MVFHFYITELFAVGQFLTNSKDMKRKETFENALFRLYHYALYKLGS